MVEQAQLVAGRAPEDPEAADPHLATADAPGPGEKLAPPAGDPQEVLDPANEESPDENPGPVSEAESAVAVTAATASPDEDTVAEEPRLEPIDEV